MADIAVEAELRERMCAVGRALWLQGMAAANDGNLSARIGPGRILCTPAGVGKGELTPEILPVVDDHGAPERPDGPKPSSELALHLRIYQLDPSVGAVVHAHPPYATVFAVLGEPLTKQYTAETVVLMPEVPLAPYGTPSTDEVPDAVAPFVTSRHACLLEHHGALTWGTDLTEAHYRMERLEHTAHVTYLLRQVGGGRELPEHEITRLRTVFAAY